MPYNIVRIVAICLLLLSCSNGSKHCDEIKRLYYQEIYFPKGYVEIKCKSSFFMDSMLNNNIKIITYVDDIICTSCLANELNIWQNEIKKIDTEVPYIIVVCSGTDNDFVAFADSLSITYPIMCYKTDVFGICNNLSDILDRNKTFLLNEDNRVILVGEPFGRKKLSKLYKRCIDSVRTCIRVKKYESSCQCLR